MRAVQRQVRYMTLKAIARNDAGQLNSNMKHNAAHEPRGPSNQNLNAGPSSRRLDWLVSCRVFAHDFLELQQQFHCGLILA